MGKFTLVKWLVLQLSQGLQSTARIWQSEFADWIRLLIDVAKVLTKAGYFVVADI
jgi:hypothetical protein